MNIHLFTAFIAVNKCIFTAKKYFIMAKYIYENANWPNFYWDKEAISVQLNEVKLLQAKLLGKMSSLGFEIQEESSRVILENEIIKTLRDLIADKVISDLEIQPQKTKIYRFKTCSKVVF